MYLVMFFLLSVMICCGVFVIGNIFCIVLLIDMLVVCVDSIMVISSLNGVEYLSLVVGCGLRFCSVL